MSNTKIFGDGTPVKLPKDISNVLTETIDRTFPAFSAEMMKHKNVVDADHPISEICFISFFTYVFFSRINGKLIDAIKSCNIMMSSFSNLVIQYIDEIESAQDKKDFLNSVCDSASSVIDEMRINFLSKIDKESKQ